MESNATDRLLRPLPQDEDTLIRAAEVPHYLGVAQQTLARWRHEGQGPRFVTLGRRVAYRARDLKEWIETQSRTKARRSFQTAHLPTG